MNRTSILEGLQLLKLYKAGRLIKYRQYFAPPSPHRPMRPKGTKEGMLDRYSSAFKRARKQIQQKHWNKNVMVGEAIANKAGLKERTAQLTYTRGLPAYAGDPEKLRSTQDYLKSKGWTEVTAPYMLRQKAVTHKTLANRTGKTRAFFNNDEMTVSSNMNPRPTEPKYDESLRRLAAKKFRRAYGKRK